MIITLIMETIIICHIIALIYIRCSVSCSGHFSNCRRVQGVFIMFNWGSNFFCAPVGIIIVWHRAVECLVSVSNCVIYILPLLLSYRYDAATSGNFTCQCFCWRPIAPRPPPPPRPPPKYSPPPPSSRPLNTPMLIG